MLRGCRDSRSCRSFTDPRTRHSPSDRVTSSSHSSCEAGVDPRAGRRGTAVTWPRAAGQGEVRHGGRPPELTGGEGRGHALAFPGHIPRPPTMLATPSPSRQQVKTREGHGALPHPSPLVLTVLVLPPFPPRREEALRATGNQSFYRVSVKPIRCPATDMWMHVDSIRT